MYGMFLFVVFEHEIRILLPVLFGGNGKLRNIWHGMQLLLLYANKHVRCVMHKKHDFHTTAAMREIHRKLFRNSLTNAGIGASLIPREFIELDN